jgi:hypothetical protein
MNKQIKLRLTGRQHAALYRHLYPGDGKEAVALALCGVGEFVDMSDDYQVVCVNRIVPVPYDICSVRTEERVTWPTELLPRILNEASRSHQVLLKIHSHPMGFAAFSNVDDDADRELFTSVAGWLDTDFPGISSIMLPDGHVMARALSDEGCFGNILSIAVVGSDVQIWYQEKQESNLHEHMLKTCQTFGQGTTSTVSTLKLH